MRLYKRKRTWWIEYQKDGRQIRRSTHLRDKKSAVAVLNALKVAQSGLVDRPGVEKMLDDIYGASPKSGIPIEAVWTTYVETARATGRFAAAPRTVEARRNVLRRFTDWLAKERPTVAFAENVTGPVAAGFASHLVTARARGGRPLSDKTRQNVIAELATVWKTLENASSGVRNPWTNLLPSARDGARMEAFSREQERAVLDAARRIGKGWELACLVARHTGLRYGDVATLDWAAVDLPGHLVRATPQKTARHGIAVEIPIAAPLLAALEAVPEADRNGPLLPNHAAVYGRRGASFYKALNFKEVLDAAGVQGRYTFHSWRHTFRSRLAEAGVSTETAMRLCGHTNEATSRHYDHDAHHAENAAAVEAAAR